VPGHCVCYITCFHWEKNSSANVNGVITQLENVQSRGNVLQVKKGICKVACRCLYVIWNGADVELTALKLLDLEHIAENTADVETYMA
jgi:hypothetical protein